VAEPSRIPFSREEEHTITSMARWMRFMAVVGLVGAGTILLLLVAALGMYAIAPELAGSSAGLARLHTFIGANSLVVYALLAAFLLAVGVGFWQNMVLYHAGDDFNLMARTDAADVDYLAHGLDKLRTFFKVQVLAIAAMMAIALIAGIVVATMWRHA
jgi:uncharacterized membrane protein (UPF0182 family)